MTKFLLDSGDTREYREMAELAKQHNSEIWGATTNPTLIAKTLAGKKLTQKEAFSLQKEIVMEILGIVPGAVSAEVYADENTTASEMIAQGEEIATWDNRIYVKLPTNLEGFKARTSLREKGVAINNTLVFSQQQIFAVTLHEQIIRQTYPEISNEWPPFISPFVGRIDDKGLNGLDLIKNGMTILDQFQTINGEPITWMLASSIRGAMHIRQSIAYKSEIITAPAKAYREWFAQSSEQKENTSSPASNLSSIPLWKVPADLWKIDRMEAFMQALESNTFDIRHELTETGLVRFAQDWKAIIAV